MHFTASLASLVGLVSCAATSAFVLPGTHPSRCLVHSVLSNFCRTARAPAPRMDASASHRLRRRSAQMMSTAERGDSDMDFAKGTGEVETARPDSWGAYEHIRHATDGTQSDKSNPAAGPIIIPRLSTTPTAPPRTEIPTEVAVVGNPQKVVEKEYSIEAILKELAEIQDQGPKNCCVLGTRHCSYLHQQIIELLAYALVLSGNHVFTSGALGTNAAAIRGALRAERDDLLTVVLPQSLSKQSEASRELIHKVKNVITMPQNDNLPLDAASRVCNSNLLTRTDQLICFAFHDSHTIIETSKEARKRNMIVTDLYLD